MLKELENDSVLLPSAGKVYHIYQYSKVSQTLLKPSIWQNPKPQIRYKGYPSDWHGAYLFVPRFQTWLKAQ